MPNGNSNPYRGVPSNRNARQRVTKPGQKKEAGDSPLRSIGMCLAFRPRWRLDPQKRRKRRGILKGARRPTGSQGQ